jgi:TetR/AcrR family transcriptional regulator, transcriptional repressor for nem operon
VSSSATSPNDTREQIIRAGRELLMTRSYQGFSFQDIADRVGIRKPSLYHHFASKDLLAIEILQRSRSSFERWTGAMQLSAAKKLDAYIRMYRDTLGAGRVMCPAGALAPSWDVIDTSVQHEVRAMRQVQLDWLTEVFGELGESRARARSRASHMFALCQGALITARMTGDAADFDDVIATARRGSTLAT